MKGTDEKWRRVEEIFHKVAALAPEKRPAFLDAACAGDAPLRQEVESLLAHEKEDGATFARGETAVGKALSAGDRLGPYEITGLIGAGGMGEVYRAYEPRLRRNVALKVLPREMSGDPARRRAFEREALAAAALNHPYIAAIYGLEEADGVAAIAMELVEGSTLSQRIAQGPLASAESLALARQITEALEYAHEKGVIHRDLKPGNIMVTGEGHVKLLDFGLARRVRPTAEGASWETVTNTGQGQIAGTVGYMAPEQVRGTGVDRRADLFSFGVVLYEMVTGERPFTGNSTMAVLDAILHDPPRVIRGDAAPGGLKTIIMRLLEKDPAKRFASAGELLKELQALEAQPRRSRKLLFGIVIAAMVLVLAAGWLARGWWRERWVRTVATPEIAQFIEKEDYVKAAALARQALDVLPKDAALEKLWMRATGEVSMASDPPGAEVSMRPYRGDPNSWNTVGTTPLKKVRVPLDDYVWRISKTGFATVSFLRLPRGSASRPRPAINLSMKLRPAASVPPDMVFVPSFATIQLAYPYRTPRMVRVPDFLIDRCEVTNQDYKKFVEAGGYRRREFWKQPFVKNGRTLSFEQAMALLTDATGRPGPATWEVGDYPKGRGQHPVAGVSWFEAAAYAEFVGKSLPTAYHWTAASQSLGYTPVIAPGGNFASDGTWPVGRPGTLSGYGTSDMAGNVKEWCWNEARDGMRFIMGGGFGEPEYTFQHTDAQQPWDRMANFGFRCVKYDSPPEPFVTERADVDTRDYFKEKPVSDEVFKAYTTLFAYDKAELNTQVVEKVTTPGWTRETVTFDAAYGHERVIAHIFLPKNAAPPFQAVIFFPAAGALSGDKLNLDAFADDHGFFLQGGRALVFPIYKGTFDRRDGLMSGDTRMAFRRDHYIAWVKDMGRTIDYLETRKDIDAGKVGFFGASMGANMGALIPAVEKRIKAEILSSGGLQPFPMLPDTDPLNFVSHITIPVLMLNGRYDSSFPLETLQRPLFDLLGTPARDKKHVIYEGGHMTFPRPQAVRECLDWLDKYLGPVRR